MISLFDEKWLPVKRRSGQVDWIAPCQIAEPDIVAFAAHRADFNGALAQLMIGLLQTAARAEDEFDWSDVAAAPPDSETLRAWFAPYAEAFVLDGDGARFMQDFTLGEREGAECTIGALLIDAAGVSAIDKNTDHFVKRDIVRAMCPHCAATALLTLQINAPAGGAGHRTSLRGGGPLTTLLIATALPGQAQPSLWETLWLNVTPDRVFLGSGGDQKKTAMHFVFPWLADLRKIQVDGGDTQPLQVHPAHVFWAMPRRIRLDFSQTHRGCCDICKRDASLLVSRYATRPQGLNYKGAWRHPFSPYYQTKEGWLPVHPQPGGLSYRHWLGWVLENASGNKNVVAASTINYALEERKSASGYVRLWVFGYDMDNMKARCWYETTFPLFELPGSTRVARLHVQELIKSLIVSAELAVFYLRQAVKLAWFGEGEMRGELSFVDKAFWDATAPAFEQRLAGVIERSRSATGIDLSDAHDIASLGEGWLAAMQAAAIRIFDVDIVGTGAIAQQDPRRVAQAYNDMQRNFKGKAIRQLLSLQVTDKASKAAKPASR